MKLKKGMLTLSARQVQHVTQVRKLEPGDEYMGLSEIIAEGGYWIKTDYTKGKWWDLPAR